jgi:hypothetical protein
MHYKSLLIYISKLSLRPNNSPYNFVSFIFSICLPFFNLRNYSFGTLICIVTYPKLIKLISSLIVSSFNYQNLQGV